MPFLTLVDSNNFYRKVHLSNNFSIFANEFLVHLCAGVRYKEFDLKEERLTYCPVFRICNIQLPGTIGSTLTLGIIIHLSKGVIYLNAWAIVCCLVVGNAEP